MSSTLALVPLCPTCTWRQKMTGIRLWVDDIRPAPAGWQHAHTFEETAAYIKDAEIDEISLDHDLGDSAVPERIGYILALLIAEHADAGLSVPNRISVHSANPVGRERILGLIKRYLPSAL